MWHNSEPSNWFHISLECGPTTMRVLRGKMAPNGLPSPRTVTHESVPKDGSSRQE